MKMTAKKKAAAAAVVLALAAALAAMPRQEAEGESLGVCYRVTGGKNQMFLLGSIHIGNEGMYPFGEAITQAMAAADTLVFECDTESPEAVAQTAALMRSPDGKTLEEQVSPECYELTRQAAEKAGYPASSLNLLRPWAAASLLSRNETAAELGMEDASSAIALGVENQIRALASGGDKQVLYLETAYEQLSAINGFSPALQEYMLASTCRAIVEPGTAGGMDQGIAQWPEWWRNGDADAFAQAYADGMAGDPEPELMAEYHSALVTRRNAGMAERLRGMLDQDERHSYFVTVGLLHLVLPGDSVLAELEGMGYTVERVVP